MHEKVTGIRQTADLYLVGVDRTQSIALDEIFGKKVQDQDGRLRTTKTFRKTRVTNADAQETRLSTKVEEDDIVVVPTNVTRGKGLC
jgi:hypothetical protein